MFISSLSDILSVGTSPLYWPCFLRQDEIRGNVLLSRKSKVLFSMNNHIVNSISRKKAPSKMSRLIHFSYEKIKD